MSLMLQWLYIYVFLQHFFMALVNILKHIRVSQNENTVCVLSVNEGFRVLALGKVTGCCLLGFGFRGK